MTWPKKMEKEKIFKRSDVNCLLKYVDFSDPPPTCTAPQGIDYNHSPDISHWTNPCLKADGSVDAKCNIYLNSGKCQEGTVCELKPEYVFLFNAEN